MPLVPPQGYLNIQYIHRRGLSSAKPAAADVVTGTLYYSTDLGIIERSNGSAWELFGLAAGSVIGAQAGMLPPAYEPDDSPQLPLIGSNIAKLDEFNPVFRFDVEMKQQLIVDGSFAVLGAAANIAATATSISTLQVVNAPLDMLGGQLKFPAVQNSSANANTLDDFERGTWTPSFGGSTSESGQVYSTQVGNYVKIGDLVIAWFIMQLSTLGTITGNTIVKGLPFTVKNTTSGAFATSAAFWNSWATAWTVVQCNPRVNATDAFILANTAAATSLTNQPTSADMNNTTDLRSILIYRATA